MPDLGSAKVRQSSGPLSQFFRGKKDRGAESKIFEEGSYAETASSSSSTAGSKSSRHSHRPKSQSIDMETGADGLNMMAGVITSIPYESLHAEGKTPIPVDYLPRGDQNAARREPLPHHLNKGGGDFHQYPAWEPSKDLARAPTNGSSVGGPRPQPSSLSSRYGGSRNGTNSVMQGSQTSLNNTLESPKKRNSGDQASIYSTVSSHTGRSSIFSSDGPVKSAVPSHVMYEQQSLRPTSSNSLSNASFRQSTASQFHPTNTFTPEGFHLERPADDQVIELQFSQLMLKRGWQHLPEQAKRQMMAYPPSKKWTLLHQDKLTEWQGEQKRRQLARQTLTGSDGIPGVLQRSDEEGSPEWYVRKVMDDSINAKQLQSLAVSLRTQPISWVKAFVEAQGQVALTNILGKINRRQANGPAPNSGTTSDRELDREYDIVKCLKALMNNKYGADDALNHQQVIVSLAQSLISPRLTTRKLVSEVLTFLCHWGEGQGHLKVLQGMDHVKHQQGENGRFDAWMRIVEVTVDGRGKMGSLVGASEEVRSGGIGMENLLMEYALASLFLLNMIIDAPEHDLQLRCHIRAQFTSCGIRRILTKMEGFQYDLIDKQIERYRDNEAIDYEGWGGRRGQGHARSDADCGSDYVESTRYSNSGLLHVCDAAYASHPG
jgi:cytokinesis protein